MLTEHFPSSLYIVDEIGNKPCLNQILSVKQTGVQK